MCRRIFIQFLHTVGACYAVPMVRGSPNPRHFRLPARLRKARKQTNLTRAGLAQKVGLTSEVAAYIEAGERVPTVATIARLASALGIAAGWLAYGLGNMTGDGPAATTDGMGARLETVRVERGLTKAALARLVDLSPSTVADIERGAQSGVEVVEALAKALNVSPAWLAYGEGLRELPKRRRGRHPAQPVNPAG